MKGLMAPTTISDIEALAVRLLARGKSRMLNDQPNLQADLLLAGELLMPWIQKESSGGSSSRSFPELART
jgi:hypothetical protein